MFLLPHLIGVCSCPLATIVTGDDRIRFLHNQTSADFQSLKSGQVRGGACALLTMIEFYYCYCSVTKQNVP